jgi:hypothetical protein
MGGTRDFGPIERLQRLEDHRTVNDESYTDKKRLFCPYCDHSSPITGDWILTVHDADSGS